MTTHTADRTETIREARFLLTSVASMLESEITNCTKTGRSARNAEYLGNTSIALYTCMLTLSSLNDERLENVLEYIETTRMHLDERAYSLVDALNATNYLRELLFAAQ